MDETPANTHAGAFARCMAACFGREGYAQFSLLGGTDSMSQSCNRMRQAMGRRREQLYWRSCSLSPCVLPVARRSALRAEIVLPRVTLSHVASAGTGTIRLQHNYPRPLKI
eukprot:876708-Amphidinium_carterae.2